MSAIKTVILNYCVCAFSASILSFLVGERDKRLFKALSFCIIAAVSLTPLVNADLKESLFSFEEALEKTAETRDSAEKTLYLAVYKNVADTLINLGIDEYEIYVTVSDGEEENFVVVTEVRVEVGDEFRDKTDEVREALFDTYEDVLIIEVKNGDTSD